MYQCILTLVTICLFTLPLYDSSIVYGEEQTKLPSWFWDTPLDPNVHYAVGYSRPHRDSPSAFDEAFSDASRRLFGDIKGVRIVGETASVNTPRGVRLVYNTMEIILDTTGLAIFQTGLFRLDSISSPELRAILITDKGATLNKSLTISPPIDNNGYVQTGIEQEYYHSSSSWIGAEHRARIEYCLGKAVSVQSLTKTWNEVVRNYTVSNADKYIIGLQSVSRRYDAEHNIFIIQVKGK